MGVSPNDPKITTQFCISSLNDAREYVRSQLYGIRHAWLQHFEYPLKVLAGSNFVYLPDDIDFQETDRLFFQHVLSEETCLHRLIFATPTSLIMEPNCLHGRGSITTTETLIGATEIDLQSSGDFPLVSASREVVVLRILRPLILIR